MIQDKEIRLKAKKTTKITKTAVKTKDFLGTVIAFSCILCFVSRNALKQ